MSLSSEESAAITISACRSCGGEYLPLILSLGSMPLANALLTENQLREPEGRYPLDLVLCPACSMVQISVTVPPEVLFRDYLYLSSYSDTMVRHAKANAERLVNERQLDDRSLVVEIASNDGYLLQFFRDLGVPVLGIEPARNIAVVAEQRGIPTLCDFFGEAVARQMSAAGRQADVILANNVMAHVPDINGVVTGIKAVLKPDGLFVMETPYLKDLIDNLEFDTIYHEHLFYFSLTALERLFRRHQLAVVDVERLTIHGGSLRVSVQHAKGAKVSRAVTALLQEEASWGVDQLGAYRGFSANVESLRDRLRGHLAALKAERRHLAAYGASAKGSTLLNYLGVGRDELKFVVDRNPAKQGRYTPGTHLPIYGPERLLEAMPSHVLLLTWNFATEILAQQAEYRRRGGRFIIPVPDPQVV